MMPMLRNGWDALVRFWQREESLSVLLGLIVVFTFVLPPLVPQERLGGPVSDVVFTFLLVAGVATVMRQGRWTVRAVVAVGLAAVTVRWAVRLEPSGAYAAWSAATTAVALVLLSMVVLTMVLRPGTVTGRRIQGAVAAYLLLGLAWAAAYALVAQVEPAAFRGADASRGAQWIYYSLITLTTTGYGDITPVHPVAQSLAGAEAFTGQVYVGVLIARLVALELQSRSAK